MLSDRQGMKSTIENSTSRCHLALGKQESGVQDPQDGIFAHMNQGTLKALICCNNFWMRRLLQ